MKRKTLLISISLVLIMIICMVALVINMAYKLFATPTSTPSVSPTINSSESLPYDRSWFEGEGANSYNVTDDNGVTCKKTIRYELMDRQSSEFIWNANCSGIKIAKVQDWYSGKWTTVTGNAAQFQTEHVVPFSLLFDAFGRHIEAANNKQMGFALYYDWDNLVAANSSLNASKSDDVGLEVMKFVCPDVTYSCDQWESPYANNKNYIAKSKKMWDKWEAIAIQQGWK